MTIGETGSFTPDTVRFHHRDATGEWRPYDAFQTSRANDPEQCRTAALRWLANARKADGRGKVTVRWRAEYANGEAGEWSGEEWV